MSLGEAYTKHNAWNRVENLKSLLADGPEVTTAEGVRARTRLAAVVAHLAALAAEEPHALASLRTLNQLDTQLSHVEQHVANWKNSAGEPTLVSAVDNYLDDVVETAARLPFTKDRLYRGANNEAQTASELAKQTVEQSKQRLADASAAFDASLTQVRAEMEKLREALAQLSSTSTQTETEIQGHVERLDQAIAAAQEEREQAIKARDAATSKAVTDLKAALDGRLAEFTSKLETEREEFEEELRVQRSEFEAALSEQRERDKAIAQSTLERLGVLEREARNSVEALGGITTSGGYAEHAKKERKTANWLRFFAIGVFAGSFVLFLVLLLTHKFDKGASLTALGFRLSGSVTLLVAGGYLARESAHHRREERRARMMQLDLNAMPAFIANLSDDKRKELQELAAKKMFTAPDSERSEGTVGVDAQELVTAVVRTLSGK